MSSERPNTDGNMTTFSSSAVGAENSTTSSWEDGAFLADYQAYQISMIIWKVWSPFILLWGGFGNIATIFVMSRIKDNNSSQYAFLMALAVSDLTLLCGTAVDGWVPRVFHVNPQQQDAVLCKVVLWVIYASNNLSAWFVTCVTSQRAMAVLWPHRMRVMCTVRRTWIVIAALVLFVSLLHSHLLFGRELMPENYCGPIPGMYQHFFEYIFPWADLCLSSFVPSVCLFVCDIILSVALFKALSSSLLVAAPLHSNTTDSRRKTSSRTTVMVLAISCTFFVLTTPECVYLIWKPYLDRNVGHATVRLLHSISHNLWLSNSAINFLLYCLTGTKFRREFMSWIRCGAQSPSAHSFHESASEASSVGRHKHHEKM
ncbi:hypothetical protein ACOMHN_042515 [Nucella lapillus]